MIMKWRSVSLLGFAVERGGVSLPKWLLVVAKYSVSKGCGQAESRKEMPTKMIITVMGNRRVASCTHGVSHVIHGVHTHSSY